MSDKKISALIIDNYDSFTFNLYQLLGDLLGTEPLVVKNDQFTLEEVLGLHCDCVIISPGPGHPRNENDFGVSKRVILEMDVPILGVCLGHQGICHFCGGTVSHAPEPMHGRVSPIHHHGSGLFQNIPSPFNAVRYHSLACMSPLPEDVVKTAWTDDGVIMGLAHRSKPIWGVQFHPESICTEHGRTLMSNFVTLTREYWSGREHSSAILDKDSYRRRSSKTVQPAGVSTGVQDQLFVRRVDQRVNPQDLFDALFGRQEIAVWLDSSMPGNVDGRFSFMAGGHVEDSEFIEYSLESRQLFLHDRNGHTSTSSEDPFTFCKRKLAERKLTTDLLPFPFNCGYIGYFGYELKALLQGNNRHPSPYPDCCLLFVDKCVVVDHAENCVYLLYLGTEADRKRSSDWFESVIPYLEESPTCLTDSIQPSSIRFDARVPRDLYLANIKACLEHIRNGESYEVCLTNTLAARTEVSPHEYYSVLRKRNPAPYSAYLKFPEVTVACSSPERFLRIRADGNVETKPIKGTIRRGSDRNEDDYLRKFLATDSKSRAENLMIVDLLRNDLGGICDVGSVSVPKLMKVETYATLHQLVSTIAGQLRDGQSAVDCLRGAFPGGSMTGAPKVRTMDIIDQLEPHARGIYSGTIGYLALNGAADLNIAIRTAVFSRQTVTIGVGGAIVAMSDPSAEWDEIMLKAKALIEAFDEFGAAKKRAHNV